MDGDEADPNDNPEMGNQMGDPQELDEQQDEAEESGLIQQPDSLGFTCNNCGTTVTPPPDSDFEDGSICPVCGKGQLLSDDEQSLEEEETDANGPQEEDEEPADNGDDDDPNDDDADEDDDKAPSKKKKGN